ncbi:uncharacterized protein LOC113909153 [Zalophus californianus]|uniref:Uncharacterized protein LOC113909153 n=1 Tax=Zalophus californianus TaxID=9704 RepID=A0A6J2B2M0_ZALCA|nr:uncharacterized protein LOC113909153 [Zalophus californianus]
MRSTCVGPARAPAPSRPAPPGWPGRGLGRPPGAGLRDGGGCSQRLGGQRPTPERAAQLVTLLKSLISSGPHFPRPVRLGRDLQALATRRRGALSVEPRVHAPVLPRTPPGREPALRAGALAPAPAPGTPRSAAPYAGKGDARGIPESSKDTSGPLCTAVSWGNRFRRSCRTVIESFREKGQGGGHGTRKATVVLAVVRKGDLGWLVQERTGSPRRIKRRRWPGKERMGVEVRRRTQSDNESWPVSIRSTGAR